MLLKQITFLPNKSKKYVKTYINNVLKYLKNKSISSTFLDIYNK